MSLQIWLPMTKDFSNQGLQNSTITNNSATLDNNGKLGKCGYFSGSTYLKCTLDPTKWTEFTFSMWVKPPAASSGNKQIVAIGTNSGWNNIRAGLLYRAGAAEIICSISDGTNALQYSTTITVIPNVWQHITVTYKNKTISWYLNGSFQKIYATSYDPKFSDMNAVGIGAASNGAEKFTGYLNDVRIYDHALSPKEIEILSRGLVCHYPLCDNSIQVSNVSNTSTTFNTSNADGGWSHWGQSGHKGSCGQTTSSTYIYTSGQSYAHRVTNNSGATGNYLMFQSPSFSATGGYRSMCAIIKEVNGNKITNDVCFPVWNGGVGTKEYIWDSISPLRDGFYLCKVESFQQDGTNNLVGIYVKPGKEIYVTNCYIENDRQACSDFIFGTNTTSYDCSGFQNNGTVSGSPTVSSDTARYSVSTNFAQSPYIQTTLPIPNGDGKQYTFSWWGKYTNYSGHMMWGYANGNRLNLYMASGNFYWNTGDGGNNPFGVSAATYGDGSWHHFAISGDGTTTKLYIDGEFKANAKTYKGVTGTSLYFNGWDNSTSYNFNGSLSDFRLYATALSAAQVAELYNTAVSVANNGALLGYELVEV